MAEREPIGVIGTGYVGLVTAAGFAELGSEVWCIDIDEAKIEGLERGEIPIWEPGLEELVARNRERMRFSTDIADALEHARLLFVAVGTPPTYSGDADLSAVYSVVDAMPASEHHALVMKSTVPVGTGRAIKRRFSETGKDGFRYVSCPEFLKEGSAVADFLHPDRVVVGDDGDWAGDAVAELYAPLDAELVRTDIASAEMVKLASNAFLATKISFINEIANVCEETGADVIEVARGMGLDDRIGPKFLQAGIGFGGSCFAGDETVLARHYGRVALLTFDELWRQCGGGISDDLEISEPECLEVLSWDPERGGEPCFLPVMHLTRRNHAGELVEVRTKMGRRLRTTPDHPFIVGSGHDAATEIVLAEDLNTEDWLPIAQGLDAKRDAPVLAGVLQITEKAGLTPWDVRVRPGADDLARFDDRVAFVHHQNPASRRWDVRRSGTMTYAEAALGGLGLRGATIGTGRNHVSAELSLDAAFWRIVGLYIAEGCMGGDPAVPDRRIIWSFHPEREQHLLEEVSDYWRRHGLKAVARRTPTAAQVEVSSRLLAAWWRHELGMARTAYSQRLPDWIWQRPAEDKWALLSGLFEGDGSWSLVNGGPSVIIEFGTVSRELADGVQRLLGDLGIVASQRVGRAAKSTVDTYWLRIAGADQVERAIELVPQRDRLGVLASVARQAKRIAPTGYRRFEESGPAWVRVTGVEHVPGDQPVYSLEVTGTHVVVTTGGMILSQCFPKDVTALKQLAGNSGYHFQLLSAVIEVNELQKRRVIGKLKQHLGPLVGKRIALLGLAFKPNTDDMREASSLVLSARLQADGAHVAAFDPVAEDAARELIQGVDFVGSALECVRDADAVVLVTEWQEFTDLDWAEVAGAMRGDLVIDGRNALDDEAIRAAGLEYEGIGRRPGHEPPADPALTIDQPPATAGSGPG
jgi:UDPglucose 6-dehydrogenase